MNCRQTALPNVMAPKDKFGHLTEPSRHTPGLKRGRRNESGSGIVESMISMLLLLLILFGLLQLSQIVLARMAVEFAAFRAARSASVGFSDYLSSREGRVRTTAVSGAMVLPYLEDVPGEDKSTQAKLAIERYMNGTEYLEYEYWRGSNVRHTSYRCPQYGMTVEQGTECGICKLTSKSSPGLSVRSSSLGDSVQGTAKFTGYPFTIPMADAFFSLERGIDLEAASSLSNHSNVFLE